MLASRRFEMRRQTRSSRPRRGVAARCEDDVLSRIAEIAAESERRRLDPCDDGAVLKAPMLHEPAGCGKKVVRCPAIKMATGLVVSPCANVECFSVFDGLQRVAGFCATGERQPIIFPSGIDHDGAEFSDDRHEVEDTSLVSGDALSA